MNYFRRDILLAAALLFTAAFTQRVLADSNQQEGEALVARGRQLWAIRATGNPAFRLKAKFRFSNSTRGEGEGTYLEVWASPQQWRRELDVSHYHQVEVGGASTRWVLHDLSLESGRLLRVAELLSLSELDLEHFKVKRAHEETNTNVRARCLEIKASDGNDETFCFDAGSGTLLSAVTNRSHHFNRSYEYSDYASFGNRRYPRKLRALSDGKAYLEIAVTDLTLEPAPEASLFVPPAGSQELPVCRDTEPPKPLSTPDPEYPNGQAGNATVVLWMIVGIDGKPHDLRVARTMGNGFDNAALKAVGRWRFRPAMCGSQPVAVQTNVEVTFRH